MNTADYLLIALLIISTIVGFMRGFLREVVALLAWIIGVLVAWHLGPLLEPHLGGLLAGPQVRPCVLVIFCQTLRLDGERWWHKSLLIPYGESIASALRSLLGEEPRARRAYSVLNTEDR